MYFSKEEFERFQKDIRKIINLEIPEPISENSIRILETCRDLHQEEINFRKRNTKKQKWDKYWVDAYNAVIRKIKELQGEQK